MTQAKAPRADAVRNRKKILDAAGEQITAHGPDIGMDQIAAAASVAVGTLYRHFPTKTDLVAAVVAEYVARVADDAEATRARVKAGARALAELTAFLSRVIEASATDRAVKAAAHALGAEPGDHTVEERAGAAVAALIRAGQDDGDIHPDVTVNDIYLLFSTAPTDRPAADRARWLALVTPGLTTNARVTGG
ncbi:TetR/AcrR family transcriptional regulator [Streptomyces paludis]|uniref:TetR family transcriptional regulator n=1 Tax=Streptomyces paludis TaxID=2282738 RepID=A0A345HNH4_9ACTN|nr:TetR/AcrR family transcriptional regulator [Streptomyces paludis]AXG78248.1 TetR family transcriptional regulator [Streptomyces paludis]